MNLYDAEIETDRLLLRPFKITDSKDCFMYLSDKDCCYNSGGYEPFNSMDDEYFELMNRFNQRSLRKMIVLKKVNVVIGSISINIIDNEVELGYVIAKKYQSRGYATESIKELCNFLMENTKYRDVIAGTIKQNKLSINLLKKLGFKYYKIKKQAFYHPTYGKCDLYYYKKTLV